jgi:hypothetical protein
VKTVSGDVYVFFDPGFTTIPWPSYADGTPATSAQCSFIVSAKDPTHTSSVSAGAGPSGLLINGTSIDPEIFSTVVVHYLIICTRSSQTLGAEEPSASLPLSLMVAPNPTTRTALVQFTLPERDRVSVEVLDVAGRLVRRLMSDVNVEGRTSQSWDLRDDRGAAVGSGVYLVKLEGRSAAATRKLTLTN